MGGELSDDDKNFWDIEIPEEELPAYLREDIQQSGRIAFNKFKSKLRKHQLDALDSVSKDDRGQICLPTGTGKTFIQKAIHIDQMLKLQNRKKPVQGVFMITAHRLALCSQLFENFIDLLVACRVRCDVLYVGSENFNFNKLRQKYMGQGVSGIYLQDIESTRTTAGDDIVSSVEAAFKNGRHLLVVSTYHSLSRLTALEKLGGRPIEVATFDESHTIVDNRQFLDGLESVKNLIKREYHFTATRKVRGDSGGHNDFDFYGKVLFEMPIKTAIDRGEIVKPKLHIVETTNDIGKFNSKNNSKMVISTIIDCFEKHKAIVKNESASPKSIGAKMLVSADGLDEIKMITEDDSFQKFCKVGAVNIFSFSSKDGEHHNFEPCRSRQAAMSKMNDLQDADDAIIFHYDILTEGIDLPAITGVLIMRDLSTIKLLQTIGRAARLLKPDRTALYENKILPQEEDKMVKPSAWVLLPTYLDTIQTKDDMEKLVREIVETYDMRIEESILPDIALSRVDDTLDRIPLKAKQTSLTSRSDLLHIIDAIRIDQIPDDVVDQVLQRWIKKHQIVIRSSK